MTVHIKAIAWLGTRTAAFGATVDLFSRVFGLESLDAEPGFVGFRLDNGDTVEVFGPDSPYNRHFTTGPVAGFVVDDIGAARAELEAEGIEFVGAIEGNGTSRWSHFRGPDGNIYELTQRTVAG